MKKSTDPELDWYLQFDTIFTEGPRKVVKFAIEFGLLEVLKLFASSENKDICRDSEDSISEDITEYTFYDNDNALTLACEHAHLEIFEYLLSLCKSGRFLNNTLETEFDALKKASLHALQSSNLEGSTMNIYFGTRAQNRLKILRKLLDCPDINVNARDAHGVTPLHHTALTLMNGTRPSVDDGTLEYDPEFNHLDVGCEMIRLLLEGTESLPNKDRKTPIDVNLGMGGDTDLFAGNLGMTALMMHCEYLECTHAVEAIRLLVEAKVDLSVANPLIGSKTALHFALDNNETEDEDYLVEVVEIFAKEMKKDGLGKSILELRDTVGETALDKARKSGLVKCEEILKNAMAEDDAS